ncbi:MAG: hypothetical protein QM770_18890 [Tepidisphaeraceae bacterium]
MRWTCSLLVTALALSTASAAPPLSGTRAGDIENSVPPVDRSESAKAREELTDARIALMDAQSSLTNTSRVISASLEASPEYQVLKGAALRARSKYEALQRPILEALEKDEAYARLHADAETARQAIVKLVEDQKANFLSLLPLAKQALEANRQMTRAEVIALALDPEVEDARQAMVDAYAKMRQLSAKFRRQAGESVNVRIAVQDLEAAKARVQAANQALADALQKEAEAERARSERIERFRSGKPIYIPDEPARKKSTDTTKAPTTKPSKPVE